MKLQCASWNVLTMSKLYLHTIDDIFLGYFFFSVIFSSRYCLCPATDPPCDVRVQWFH